jgi:hypothetical protein
MEDRSGAGEGIGRVEARDEIGAGLEGSDFVKEVLKPTLLAVFFAILSLPFVALSLDAAEYGAASGYGVHPVHVPDGDLGRWAGAFGAVVAAALVAGTVGAPVVRVHAIRGALFTTLVAWVVGITALPVLPALLHLNRNGDLGFAMLCLDSCGPLIHTSDAFSGLGELKFFWLGPIVAPVAFGLLVVGAASWTRVVRRWIPKREPTLS